MSYPEEPVRKSAPLRPCCCVLINHLDNDREHPCVAYASGPDDPFCDSCASRHPEVTEDVGVTQRLPVTKRETDGRDRPA